MRNFASKGIKGNIDFLINKPVPAEVEKKQDSVAFKTNKEMAVEQNLLFN